MAKRNKTKFHVEFTHEESHNDSSKDMNQMSKDDVNKSLDKQLPEENDHCFSLWLKNLTAFFFTMVLMLIAMAILKIVCG